LKIKIEVSKEKYKEIEEKLLSLGIEIDDDADFILTEKNHFSDYISCRKNEDICHVLVSDIIYIESMGHDIYLHTIDETYRVRNRLWQLEKSLNPDCFLRISNSVIVAKNKVKKIRAALSQKFILTLENGSNVDVTRSYYYIFKNEFGI
jgi:DNA-binding LytR/AlgR family response regulator